MPPRASKQSDRNTAKKAAKTQDEEVTPASNNAKEQLMSLVKGSVLLSVLPKLPELLKEQPNGNGKVPAEDEVKEEKEGEDEQEETTNGTTPAAVSSASTFDSLKKRLAIWNGLGIFPDGDCAKAAFLKLKSLEFDGGPKTKKKGTPAVDRLVSNASTYAAQYIYFMWGMMMLRSILFRSWFAFLPWMFVWQIVSLLVPLTNIEKLPQVPLEKVPTKFRVVGTMALHVLVWFFFIYEFLFRARFLEWFFYSGLLVAHAYVFRQEEK